jgi:flagellin-like protein
MSKKRGLSPVIAVVLLLAITVVAATIIVSIVLPFIKGNLEEGKECFDVLGDLKFASTKFNCYIDGDALNPPTLQLESGFSVRNDNEKIIGFAVTLVEDGTGTTIEVIEGNSNQKLRNKGGVYNSGLMVPAKGEIRTYVYEGIAESIELFPILNDNRKCEEADSIKLNECGAQIMLD